jgi:small subunit ribosomal protein S16
MVVKIRLSRWGARNNPFYGIVVANARAARDGKHLERVGTYNPIPDQNKVKHVELNVERIKYWLSVGAQPSDRVAWLLAKASLMPPTPTFLHKVGLIDLNDKHTWNVQITDEKGNNLMSMKDAEQRNLLPKQKEPANNQLDPSKIALDGQKPTEPLTEQESLLVLKTYLGIS